MYDCALRISLVACPEKFVKIIKAMPPLANFRHIIEEMPEHEAETLSRANLVVAGSELSEIDFRAICAAKNRDARLVLLYNPQNPPSGETLGQLADIWPATSDEDLIRFQFSRCLENFRRDMDLWQSNQFLESVLSASPNLVWFKTRDGVHELVSESFCRTVNKPRADVQGKKHAYIWNVEKDDPACVESERIVMESGKTHSFEESVETGDGKRLLTTYKTPLRNVDGQIMGTMGIGVDITKERLYRQKLEENNAALEAIFTSMDCGILCHTLEDSRIISVNENALRLLGFSSQKELEEGGFQRLVASTVLDEDKAALRDSIKKLKKAGDSTNYEYRVRHADGKLIHVMGKITLVEKDGELICQRFMLDCTAQKIAEEREQSKREKRQMELVRALCVDFQLVCVVDAHTSHGRVLQLLPAPDKKLREIFAGDAPLARKMHDYLENCVHPDDRSAFSSICSLESLEKELKHRKIFYFNYRAMNEGDVRYFQLKAVRSGKDPSYFGIVIGLQSVDSRTRRELEQKSRLSEALKQAKKASHAKSLFLSNMSHDIRTPMNAVVGYTTLALKNIDDQGVVRSYLDKILVSGNHLISLINDILDMSYIESGKIQLEEKPCELGVILRELWSIVQPTAQAKNQHFSIQVENVSNEAFYCDKLRLNQVLLNLLSNSVKYTRAGGTISMVVRQLDCARSNHGFYEFHIRDNGIGMSEEFLSRIFEPFERAQTSTVAGIQGTGLGMSITKNIVEMMGGDIEVKSKLNKGTDFLFRVTLRLAESAQKSAAGVNAEEDDENLFVGMRILLAEDNPMNQEIANEFLTSAGYLVDIASNGQEAVQMLQEHSPGYYGVVLMDVQMPVVDGYKATEMIRALPDRTLASIPIIAMTANSFEEDRRRAMQHGMNGHIAKPIDFKILFRTLKNLFSGTLRDVNLASPAQNGHEYGDSASADNCG